MAVLSALILLVFHKGELAVFDIQEWIIFQSQKFFFWKTVRRVITEKTETRMHYFLLLLFLTVSTYKNIYNVIRYLQ